jgi:hypothetical protein
MTFRLASGIAGGIARLIGFGRSACRRRAAGKEAGNGFGGAIDAAETACQSRYVVAAPLLRCLGGWSVHNRASVRVVAAGLTREQAQTLARVLDLACDWSRNPPTDALTRKGED